jgi:hypothetical protein
MRWISRRCTYANVVASMALFFALTGGAYAVVGNPFVSNDGAITTCVQPVTDVLKAEPVGARCPRGYATITLNQMGQRGERGPRGATGPRGDNGAPGLPGATGDTGPPGPQGLPGPQGATGATGATGAQGLKGDKGDTGPQGLKGDKGDTGATGAQGPAGFGGKQVNTFGPVAVATGNIASLIEGCTSSAFPNLIGGGYSTSPAALVNVAPTVNGPSGSNSWAVDIVNNSGISVSFTEYTVCTS